MDLSVPLRRKQPNIICFGDTFVVVAGTCRVRLHCVDLCSPIRWEILGNIIFIKKLFIYFFTFIYFQRARAFFPREEGTRKYFSVADGLIEIWQSYCKRSLGCAPCEVPLVYE